MPHAALKIHCKLKTTPPPVTINWRQIKLVSKCNNIIALFPIVCFIVMEGGRCSHSTNAGKYNSVLGTYLRSGF